jgi:hypothetical protein
VGENRDRAAHVLLFPLLRVGPLRQGALAELVHADLAALTGLFRRFVDGLSAVLPSDSAAVSFSTPREAR